jgi:hypothetical protein
MVNPSYIAAKIKDLIITNSIERSDIQEFFLVIHKLMPYLSTIRETRMFLKWYGESIHKRALPNIDKIAMYLRGYNKVTEHLPDPHEQGATFILMKLFLLRRSFSMIHYYLHYELPNRDPSYINTVVKPYLKAVATSLRIIKEQNFDLNIEERLKKIREIRNLTTFNRHYDAQIELLKIEVGAMHPLVEGLTNFWASQYLTGGAADRANRAEQQTAQSNPASAAAQVPAPEQAYRNYGDLVIKHIIGRSSPEDVATIKANLAAQPAALEAPELLIEQAESYKMDSLTPAQADTAIIEYFGALPQAASAPPAKSDEEAEPAHKKLKTKGKNRAAQNPADNATASGASDESEAEVEPEDDEIVASTHGTQTCAFLRTGRACDMGKRLDMNQTIDTPKI